MEGGARFPASAPLVVIYFGILRKSFSKVNPLTGTGNRSATSNNRKLVHWPLMGGLLHLVHSEKHKN